MNRIKEINNIKNRVLVSMLASFILLIMIGYITSESAQSKLAKLLSLTLAFGVFIVTWYIMLMVVYRVRYMVVDEMVKKYK